MSTKPENETEISCDSSCSSSSRDSANGNDTESVDFDTPTKSTSLDFSFADEKEIPALEVATSTATITEEDEKYESTINQQEEVQLFNENFALVGASGASVDDKWQMVTQKRVLSSNTLAALNQEAGHHHDSLKRMRCSRSLFKDISAISESTLDIEALDQTIQPLPRQYLVSDDSSLIEASNSDEKEDKMLNEELFEDKFRNDNINVNSSIPLLTPPQSPRTIDDTETSISNDIEWPSNLVMDSAITQPMTNVQHLLPVSAVDSLDEGEEKLETHNIPVGPSCLTSLLQSIYVGDT